MPDYQSVFKRTEIKYLMSVAQESALMDRIGDFLCKDLYSESTISNLYFDTEDYHLIRASIEKPLYKEKLRLRCYGTPSSSGSVFIELKKKLDGTVYKRRLSLPYADALSYLAGRTETGDASQIRKEIDWFMKRYPLAPKAFISYDRSAYKGKTEPGLRVTFDRNVQFRCHHLDLTDGRFGQSLLDRDQALMEIKMNQPMPLWLSASLNDLKIFPTSFSKYGNCYKAFILDQAFERKGGVGIAG